MARTGRPREFNRDDAVKKAMQLFWRKGYESTSLAELRETLGNLSAASFYAAFGSKQALYCECLELYEQTCGETVSLLEDSSLTAAVALERMFHKTISMQTSPITPMGCMAVLSGLNCCDENGEIEAVTRSFRNKLRHALAACVKRGVAAGEWNHSMDVASYIVLLETYLNGISIQARDGVGREALIASLSLLMSVWKSA